MAKVVGWQNGFKRKNHRKKRIGNVSVRFLAFIRNQFTQFIGKHLKNFIFAAENFLNDILRCPLTDLIATGCGDNAIRIFRESDSTNGSKILNEDFLKNQPEFEHVQTIENAHEQDVNCVRWNPKTGKILLSCSDDGSVKLWRNCDTMLGLA